MHSVFRRLVLLALMAMPLSAAGATNLIQNGSFESNGGPGSNSLPGWKIVDEAGGDGTWVAQTGAIGPVTSTCGPDAVSPPPDGSFAAMTRMAAPGSHVLYQDVAIPAGATPVLSFQFYIRSPGRYWTPDSLSHDTDPNQQFRVDIIDPSSNEFTLNVLQNVLTIGKGNEYEFRYETQTATLAGFGGRTIRIRFAEVDNQRCFYAGIDNVRLEIGGDPPAPAIVRFVASQDLISFAAASTLTWVTQHATSVQIDHGIGDVPLTGSRSVSLQSDTTYTITATGPAGTARRVVKIVVSPPGPYIRYLDVSPGFVDKGQPVTLSWGINNADAASISPDVGAVSPASGSITVTPSATTQYTLTATGLGLSTSARATAFVNPGNVPVVSLTSTPNGMVQVAGSSGATDHFSLTNLGSVGTTIQLSQSGDFFTQSPTSFDLPPKATQTVTVTPTVQTPGKFDGASIPAGNGWPAGQGISLRLFIATPPTGTIAPTIGVARTEIAAPANENPSGSVSFSNAGTGTLQGIVTSDAAWLIPQTDPVIIGPGATREVKFTTNRALRPDASSPAGAAVGTITLSYLDFKPSSGEQVSSGSGSSTGSISVTVVDVVKANANPGTPSPLSAGEIAYFVPGLAQLPKSSGDLLVSVIGNSVSDLKLFLGAPGSASVLGSLDQIAPNAGVALPSVLQTVFASSAPTGTVQARSASLARVAISGMQTNTPTSLGSFITALPTFRSDRSAASGEVLYLAGVEKGATRSTSVFVQEVNGFAATAKVESLATSGSRDATRARLSLRACTLPVGALLAKTVCRTDGSATPAFGAI
jgi:hypothetical protein